MPGNVRSVRDPAEDSYSTGACVPSHQRAPWSHYHAQTSAMSGSARSFRDPVEAPYSTEAGAPSHECARRLCHCRHHALLH